MEGHLDAARATFLRLLEHQGLVAYQQQAEEAQGSGDLCPTQKGWVTALVISLFIIRSLGGLFRVISLPFLCLALAARLVLGVYQYVNIGVDFVLGGSILFILIAEDYFLQLFSKSALRIRFGAAQTYGEYRSLCHAVDREEGKLSWRDEERDLPQVVILRRTLDELEDALSKGNILHLRFTLGGLFRRNHLGIDHPSLHHKCLSGTKYIIERYQQKLTECLNTIAETKQLSLEEKRMFFRQARRSLGRTALCLSGGGGITMYHLGCVRALIEAGLFRYIKVFSGASGGSILAALIAMKTEKELMEEVLLDTFSTDFTRDGRQAAERIRWFFRVKPFPIMQVLLGWGLLDKHEFERTTTFYLGDVTFAEAYQRTGRHVSISVSSSSLAGYGGAEELLLNHLTTPNVLLRSAVVASSSLPGVLAPSTLLSKNLQGQVEPFILNGVEWIDGSVQADIPLRGITSMFSVSNCIVSQVNPHVVPFLNDEHTKLHNNPVWQIFKMLAMDVSYRANSLQQLKLLPTFFGQDMSGVFKQVYSGQVTITQPFRFLDSLATKAILTPSRSEMHYYITVGQRSCWKHLQFISHLMGLEVHLARCSAHLASTHHQQQTRRVPSPLVLQPLHQHHHHQPWSLGSENMMELTRRLSVGGMDSEDDEPTSMVLSAASMWREASGGDGGGDGDGVVMVEGEGTGPAKEGAQGEGDEEGEDDDDDGLVIKEFELKGDSNVGVASGRSDGGGGSTSPSQGLGNDGKGDEAAGRPVAREASAAEHVMEGLRSRMKWLEDENTKLQEQLSEFLGSVDHVLHYESNYLRRNMTTKEGRRGRRRRRRRGGRRVRGEQQRWEGGGGAGGGEGDYDDDEGEGEDGDDGDDDSDSSSDDVLDLDRSMSPEMWRARGRGGRSSLPSATAVALAPLVASSSSSSSPVTAAGDHHHQQQQQQQQQLVRRHSLS